MLQLDRSAFDLGRNRSTKILATVILFCALAHFPEVYSAEDPPAPNVVLILVDDLGYGELGCQGNSQIPTPNIDSIAKNGVRFTSGYVTASYCSPSRAGLLTGRYQTRFGYELNPVGRHNLHPKAGLPVSETTIASQLKQTGYTTAMFGKWHLGGHDVYHPLNRGFDRFFGFLHEGHFFVPPPYDGVLSFLRKKDLPAGNKDRLRQGNMIYTSHMGSNEPPYDDHNPILRGRDAIVEETYLTDAFTREAVDFLETQDSSNPFFLYLPYNAVHSPLQARFEDMQPFSKLDVHRRVFAGMLKNLDDNIGKVLDTLKTKNLEQNTLVIFLSDNGGPTKELTSSNRPLRGGKGNLYEGGIRIPFLMQWKGQLPKGKEYHHPVISTDIFATVSAAAGLTVDQDKLDGVDLIPYLKGAKKGKPHETLYWRMRNKTALRHGDWKIVRHPERGQSNAEFELYNLKTDLAESKNLAKTHPEKRRELEQIWKQLNGQMREPVWHPGL